MNKSVLWKQVQMVLDSLSVLINRVASVVKRPTGKHQMLVTDENGEGKWVKRTHWEELGEEILLDNVEMEFVQGPNVFFIGEPLGLEVGEKYKVIWNGTEHVCTAVETVFQEMPGVAVGNVNGDTNDPFVVFEPPPGATGSDIFAVVFPLDTTVRLILTIKHVTDTVHKLDPKYLPDGIGGVADWNAQEGEPGHILNKPFGDKTVVTVFPETTIPFNEDASGWVTDAPVAIPPEGTECTVTINGTAHEATLKMLSLEGLTVPVLGNASVLGEEDTGETFFIMMVPPEMSEMAGGVTMKVEVFDGSTEAITLSIEAESVKKIDYEFMPAGYPKIETKVGTILPETEIVIMGQMRGTKEPLNGNFINGKTYTVNISGTEYQTTAKFTILETGIALMCLGNLDVFGWGEDTGEPFLAWVVTPKIADLYENATFIIEGSAISGTGHTISISGEMEAVTEMDSRFVKTAIADATKGYIAPYNASDVSVGDIVYCAFVEGGQAIWAADNLWGYLTDGLAVSPPEHGFMTCINGQYVTISNAFTFGQSGGVVLNGVILNSTTPGSSKRFKISVDDSGTISATEVT